MNLCPGRWTVGLLSIALSALGMNLAAAATIVCDGVLGNSGEQGATLVQFGAQNARGIGVAVDRFGSLWDRAGKGVLNRYASDGRLLGAYRIPSGENGNDQIAIAGDTLVLLLNGRLHTLAVTAPAGSEATALAIKAKALSFAAYKERVALLKGDTVVWFDPATSAIEPIDEMKDLDAVEVGNDGVVFARGRNQLHRLDPARTGARTPSVRRSMPVTAAGRC